MELSLGDLVWPLNLTLIENKTKAIFQIKAWGPELGGGVLAGLGDGPLSSQKGSGQMACDGLEEMKGTRCHNATSDGLAEETRNQTSVKLDGL